MDSKNQLEERTELMDLTISPLVYSVPKEEKICTTQIKYLAELSENRELTLDEVKKLEILVKTLFMIRGKTIDIPKKKSSDSLKNEDLMRIIKG